MNAQLDSVFFYQTGSFRHRFRVRVFQCARFVVFIYGIGKIFINSSYVAFHERGCEVIYDSGVASAFCHHGFSDVRGGVDIEMWHVAYESVGPIVASERHLLARSELKGAVCAEVNKSVSLETIFCPKVCGDIIVRRSGVSAVHNLEIIIAQTCGGLRNQHDIAESESCQREIPFPIVQPMSRKLTVNGVNLFSHLF